MKGQTMTQAASDDAIEDVEVDEDVEQPEDEDTEQTDEADDGDKGEPEGAGSEGGEADETEEVVVSIGEESPTSEEDESHGKPAPAWVKDLRERNRELSRENRELKAKGSAQAADKAVEVGQKPTLEGCDFDADRFERDLTAWHQRKQEADAKEREKQKQMDDQAKAWQAKLDAYGKAKAELKVSDFDDAEGSAHDVLSQTQQGVIVHGADNPALLVYALGKNPKKAKELASITDPVRFAFAVAKLETQLKVTQRKTAPLPERTVRSGGGTASVHNAGTLQALREKAQRTGDYTAYFAAKTKIAAKS